MTDLAELNEPETADVLFTADEVARGWVKRFATALKAGDAAGAAALFADEGSWRDLLGFSWEFTTAVGPTEVEAMLASKLAALEVLDFSIAPNRSGPAFKTRMELPSIEIFIDFVTSGGCGQGVVRLIDVGDNLYKAYVVLTALGEIKGYPEWAHLDRESVANSREFGGENWLDKRVKAQQYIDRNPVVLVVGGGQAGLGVAARLRALDIDTLIVDAHDEVGDCWRTRYHSLALHNEVYGNHLPYMPFPPSAPRFLPKDKLADFFRAYVEGLDLNYWTGTYFVGGGYDEAAGCWDVEVNKAGVKRRLRPRHIVFATGVSAIPLMPDLPGLKDFAGTLMHSGAYEDGQLWRGKRAVVLGTGNSAHDVAQDLYESGAEVTMVQRSPTTILSLEQAQKLYTIYTEGRDLEEADLLTMAVPYPVLVRNYKVLTRGIREADAELLDGLAQRGFKLDFGPDDTGFQMKYLTRGGGYYFNVGASDLIIDGSINIQQFDEIDRFVPRGILKKDGSILEADLIVAATGYANQQEVVRRHLGDEVADKIGPVWGFGDERELRNMWYRTPQKGLWFNGGSMTQSRMYSKFIGLLIKAEEVGLI